jgi:hypothetical protein
MHFRTILPSILGITLATALNITYPRASSFILNTTSLTITWTTSSTDLPELNFVVSNTNASSAPMAIGTNMSTSDLKLIAPIKGDVCSFHITVNSIGSEGNEFVAQSAAFDIKNPLEPMTTSAAPAASSSEGVTVVRGNEGLFVAVAVGAMAFCS